MYLFIVKLFSNIEVRKKLKCGEQISNKIIIIIIIIVITEIIIIIPAIIIIIIIIIIIMNYISRAKWAQVPENHLIKMVWL